MSALTVPRLLTAEEFAEMPDDGVPKELVRGEIVPMNVPYPRHGEICVEFSFLLKSFLIQNPIGRVVGNDGGVVTEQYPDTVRGADVAFYSYERVPKGRLPRRGYLKAMPELVVEVRSYFDRWTEIHVKVGEYLAAGVDSVVVLDEQTERAFLYRADEPPVEFAADQELVLPPPLAGWRVRVGQFFE